MIDQRTSFHCARTSALSVVVVLPQAVCGGPWKALSVFLPRVCLFALTREPNTTQYNRGQIPQLYVPSKNGHKSV